METYYLDVHRLPNRKRNVNGRKGISTNTRRDLPVMGISRTELFGWQC